MSSHNTTREILFNSPALHSLKRDQLVKLCKLHSVKANGKNAELIDRLKQHALTLPSDSPLNVATRSEIQRDDANSDQETGEDEGGGGWRMPRPSEQWEMVMESIAEEEGSGSQGTLSSMKTLGAGSGSTGEFGNSNGSKGSGNSVSSSIKALATSLGLKRHPSATSKSSVPPPLPTSLSQASIPTLSGLDDDLSRHAVPYSALPQNDLPETDHFVLQTTPGTRVAPVPGQPDLPGVPAPANPYARMSLSNTPTANRATTTIRLVSVSGDDSMHSNQTAGPETPNLRPFATSFDLVGGTPGVGGFGKMWPASPGGAAETQAPATPTRNMANSPLAGDAASPTGPAPFVFGSPGGVSNVAFRSAAASVLDEMNARLAKAGVEGVSTDLLHHTKANGPVVDLGSKGLGITSSRFDKQHEQQFAKMDSIADHWSLKRTSPGKTGGAAPAHLSKKRKSSVLGDGRRGPVAPAGRRRSSAAGRGAGARVISAGTRRRMIPGGFGDEDDDNDDDEETNRRLSKRPRVETETAPVNGEEATKPTPAKVSIVEKRDDVNTTEGEDAEETKRQKEREAIRRKLDREKARRRSSMGRPSMGAPGKAPLANHKGKGMTSRFGFLSSAKTMVANVWNRGATAKSAPPNTTATNGKTSSIPLSKNSAAPKAAVEAKKPHTAASSTRGARSSAARLMPPPSAAVLRSETVKSTSSSRVRSPIPSFSSRGASRNSTVSSRAASATGSTGPAVRSSTRASNGAQSVASASSIGTRSSSRAAGSTVSSLGTRSSLASTGSGSGTGRNSITRPGGTPGIQAGDKGSVRARTQSRLTAPTASSLAKAQGNAGRASMTSQMHDQNVRPAAALPSVAEDQSKSADVELASGGEEDERAMTVDPRSPKPRGMFGTQYNGAPPSAIPSPVRQSHAKGAVQLAAPGPLVIPKGKGPTGRKPRISRSKVIAKLASQRAASGSSVASASSSRTRSSFGAGVRSVKTGRRSGGGDVVMSAKKRARQSEHARRKSRVAAGSAIGIGRSSAGVAMEVD